MNTTLDSISARKDSSVRECIRARGEAAFIELTCLSVWEEISKPVYLSLAAILGIESLKICLCEHKAEPSKPCSCPKTRLHLRKKSGISDPLFSCDKLDVGEDHATIKRMIQRAQRLGFATSSDVESSNA